MGSPCTTNVSTWTDPTLSNSILIKEVHFTQLQTAITNEYTRRGLTATFSYPVANETYVSHNTTLEDYNLINPLGSFTWTSGVNNVTTGSLVLASEVTELRNNINIAQQACICNCNYCTCNCNYCTCNCNYCTCNCNYCTCNCNYTCTCNCNY